MTLLQPPFLRERELDFSHGGNLSGAIKKMHLLNLHFQATELYLSVSVATVKYCVFDVAHYTRGKMALE